MSDVEALVARSRWAEPDVHCELENIFSEGDFVAWLVRTTGTHTGDDLGFPATGKRFETVSANIGRLRDGKAAGTGRSRGCCRCSRSSASCRYPDSSRYTVRQEVPDDAVME